MLEAMNPVAERGSTSRAFLWTLVAVFGVALATFAYQASGPGPMQFAAGHRVALSDYRGGDPTGVPAALRSATLLSAGSTSRGLRTAWPAIPPGAAQPSPAAGRLCCRSGRCTRRTSPRTATPASAGIRMRIFSMPCTRESGPAAPGSIRRCPTPATRICPTPMRWRSRHIFFRCSPCTHPRWPTAWHFRSISAP